MLHAAVRGCTKAPITHVALTGRKPRSAPDRVPLLVNEVGDGKVAVVQEQVGATGLGVKGQWHVVTGIHGTRPPQDAKGADVQGGV